MVKLTGIVEDTFTGRTVFRGYATLRTLYALSVPGSYQRNECKDRFSDIVDFFRNSSFTFFPELLFGWQIDDNEFLKKLKGEQLQGTIKLPNGIEIKKAKFSFQQNPGEEPTTKVISIFIPESLPLFTRIDGNHRLSALKDIYEQEKQAGVKDNLLNMYVPFSILVQINNDEAQKYEQAFFYLINAKSVPLTDEENLKAILEENTFTNEEKKSLLKITNIDTIETILNIIKSKSDKLLSEIFGNNVYTFCVKILQLLDTIDSQQFEQTITHISALYNLKILEDLSENACLACIKFKYEQKEYAFDSFKKWLLNSKMLKIKKLSPNEIIDFYNNNFKKQYTVFVAMPYISDARVVDFNKLFVEVLDDISKNQDYELHLIPIMRFRGRSQRIDQRLIEKINECDIFIADLTTCNENVIFEIGLAEGAKKPMILIKADSDSSRVPFEEIEINNNLPFDMDKLQWIPYSSTGYYNKIKSIMKNNIPEILKELEKKD